MNANTTLFQLGDRSASPAGAAGLRSVAQRQHGVSAKSTTIPQRELTFVLRNLATLVENGLALPKSLSTLARERSLKKYAGILEALRRSVESGDSFSTALTAYPASFNEIIVNQIRVAERSGTLAASLDRIAQQLEKSSQMRSQVTRKLAYPAVLMIAGSIAVTFMLLFVVPVFQKTYAESKVPLPMITRALIAAGELLTAYGWIIPVTVVAALFAIRQARRNPVNAQSMDRTLLKVPVIGPWIRDLSVLEFMDVLGNLLESGFNVVDALSVSAGSIRNRAVRQSVEDLQSAVTRGERFSRELDKQGDLFPPVVNQLVIVGEKTGNLAKATTHIRQHLRQEIERTTAALVGTIEPVLTITLAAMIGCILLAIYLPMFDMIGAMSGPGGK